MKRSLVLTVLAAVLLSGCQTTQTNTTRADLLRYVDGAQLAVNVALSFAEVRGADAVTLTTAREHSMLTFALLRDALSVDTADLPAAAAQLRVLAADVFALCEGVGVNAARMAALREGVERVLVVLEGAV